MRVGVGAGTTVSVSRICLSLLLLHFPSLQADFLCACSWQKTLATAKFPSCCFVVLVVVCLFFQVPKFVCFLFERLSHTCWLVCIPNCLKESAVQQRIETGDYASGTDVTRSGNNSCTKGVVSQAQNASQFLKSSVLPHCS